MSVAAAESPRDDASFSHASAAEVRAALISEDAARFEQRWREVLARAADSLDLSEVQSFLASWRRVAWVTNVHGQESYRRMLTSVEHRLQTGERAAGSVSWDQLKDELGLGG